MFFKLPLFKGAAAHCKDHKHPLALDQYRALQGTWNFWPATATAWRTRSSRHIRRRGLITHIQLSWHQSSFTLRLYRYVTCWLSYVPCKHVRLVAVLPSEGWASPVPPPWSRRPTLWRSRPPSRRMALYARSRCPPSDRWLQHRRWNKSSAFPWAGCLCLS